MNTKKIILGKEEFRAFKKPKNEITETFVPEVFIRWQFTYLSRFSIILNFVYKGELCEKL